MGLIPNFNKNYLFGEIRYWMPLALTIQAQLTENFIYNMAQNIYFNLNVILQIKMI